MKLLLLLCLMFAMPVLGDALSDTKAFAEKGYANAQFELGLMYKAGLGVAQDYKAASKWWRLAADQGYVLAQFNLGFMYNYGLGVAQDYRLAHMWYNIAAANGNGLGSESRSIIAKKMSPEAIDEAQKMAREWIADHE